ncbi:hypothetical protein IJH23_02050 [Candidatus Saccharibacteria bacterium]|nr:hypothetical protein [Candidatus Saccharibacteria bacterium]
MLKDKRILTLSAITILEVVAAVILIMLKFNLEPKKYSIMDEFDSLNEYCQIYDDENCEEYQDDNPKTDFFYNIPISQEASKDFLPLIYASILNKTQISHDSFMLFVALSNSFGDNFYYDPISGKNEPVMYHAINREIESSKDRYPFNYLRSIRIDIPNEGCAIFDFSPDFSLLQDYELLEGSCDNPS